MKMKTRPAVTVILAALSATDAWGFSENAALTVPAPPDTVSPNYPTTPAGIFQFNVGVIITGGNGGDTPTDPQPYLQLTGNEQYQWQYIPCGGIRSGGCSHSHLTASSTTSASYTSPTVFKEGESVDAKFTFTYHGTLDFHVQEFNSSPVDRYSLALFDANGHQVGLDSRLDGTYVLDFSDPSLKSIQLFSMTTTPVPIPAPVWLMMSASIGLFGAQGRKRLSGPVAA